MKRIKRTAALVCCLLLFGNTADAKSKNIVRLETNVQNIESRLQRIESRSDNQALIELYKTIEALKQEVQDLRNENEQLANEINGVSKRQRNMYLDIDRRINDLQLGGGAETGAGSTMSNLQSNSAVLPGDKSPQAATAKDSKQERDDYGTAFNYLKEGRYAEAVIEFKQFVATHSNSRYVENAQYWLGEANYASRQFEAALLEFEKVLKNYPSSTKVPGAKLKMGYTYYELERWREGREILNDVLRNYPSSSVAPLAEKRLIRMTKEGH